MLLVSNYARHGSASLFDGVLTVAFIIHGWNCCLHVSAGKQFRVIIMTAVQTRDSLKRSHLHGVELFNDVRVLNTAMTRAQSQVVVVGDAAALCLFGKCSGVWRSYIDHCFNNNSVAPEHFTKTFFEKDVTESARFQRLEPVDEGNSHSDAILQELKEEYEQMETEFVLQEDRCKSKDFSQHDSEASMTKHENVNDNDTAVSPSERCTQGTVVRDTLTKGYVIPLQHPSKRISIKGKANMHRVFTGDKVVIQDGKVTSITKEDKSARVLVCLLDDEDHSRPRQNFDERFVKRIMTPITKSAPKVCILLAKQKRHLMPIWEQEEHGSWTIGAYQRINEKLRQNFVFLVQVVNWREQCYYPLGKVIKVIPTGETLNEGMKILNAEFKVDPTKWKPGMIFSKTDEDEKHRQDMVDVLTFTVDPLGAEDLDDAISVRDLGDEFELGIHIADVASFVSKGSDLDEDAQRHGSTFYHSKGEPTHMFHKDLSTGYFSLLEGQKRRVVSMLFNVKKQTNEIAGGPKLQLSLIRSDKQLSYDEAEKHITERYRNGPQFSNWKDCVAVAYCFAKAQRQSRLKDWVYAQPDDSRLPGKRKAHLMIEELSVLFNAKVSKVLIDSQNTRYCTPLRCQAPPDPEKIKELRNSNSVALLPLSFHIRHRVDCDKLADDNTAPFRILTEVWSEIQKAAKTGDLDKMVDLIAADDIHPLLQPVIHQFRRCSNKTYVICSNSSPKAEVGHDSLNLHFYTQASSPIRRYMDIVLQRLLHSHICGRRSKYNKLEISAMCNDFELYIKNAKSYEEKSEKMSYAVCMKRQSIPKLAFVVNVEPNREGFAVSFPFNKNVVAGTLAIMYKDLQLWDQPLFDEKNQCVTLKWKRRIYNAEETQELKMAEERSCIEFPLKTWKSIIETIDKGEWERTRSLILTGNTNPEVMPESSNMPGKHISKVQNTQKFGHEIDKRFHLKVGDTLKVQMTAELERGYHMPAMQLLHIDSWFEICVDHVHNPIKCFSESADDPTRIQYSDENEYIRIWKPLCEMESATAAVDKSHSITIENLMVTFHQEREGTLSGNFFLSMDWMKKLAIEFHLSKCLLCIRKRCLPLTSGLEYAAQVDPKMFTWVTHGVTTKVIELKSPEAQGNRVEFIIAHMPMSTLPSCVMQRNTLFTVEIIPKLLPDT